jgi:two-component system response regulator YesN
MTRLLLVDDEKEILDWLYELFQEAPDLELDVYKALSGYEALDILARTKIDIVVSDIKMPGMGGLQLFEQIRSRWPLCRVVFLTGYNEFDYVYAAIKYEGVSYLLKTEEDEVILGEVKKAIADLEKSAQNRELMERVRRYMEEARPFLQRGLILSLILDPSRGAALTQAMLDELGIPLKRERPVLLAAGRFDRFPDKATPAFGFRMAASLTVKAEELMGGNFAFASMIHQSNIDVVWLLQPKTEERAAAAYVPLLAGALEALQDYSRAALGLPVSFVYATTYSGWEQIEESYATLSQLINASAGMGEELLLNELNFTGLYGRPEPSGDAAPLIAARKSLETKALPGLLERGDREAFLPAISPALDALGQARGRNNGAALELYYAVATMLLGHINRRNLADRLPAGTDLGKLMRADAHAAWQEAAEYLHGVAAALFELQRGAQEKNVNDSVDRVKQYIREHLGEDLSLVRLAEISYFNPSYLSRLFKQATGQNLTDYIAALRIERAKAMLSGHGRISDISLAIGFESQHYFSRFFKKFTGFTPQEFRESLINL